MKKNLPLSQEQIDLPTVDLIEKTELAFGDAFFRAAQVLHQHMQTVQSSIELVKDFTQEPFNLAILGLFYKMSRCYYSYVLLEVHHDRNGSQLLLEHLCESAITLIYLLEKGDRPLFRSYISASVSQAYLILDELEAQLQQVPNHPELLILRKQLKAFIATNQPQLTSELPLADTSATSLWGLEEANTTIKRGIILGLNFLANPARQVALRVTPGSWLDLQLNYLNSFTEISPTKERSHPNLLYLRDAAHLCMLATQALLEEVDGDGESELLETKRYQQLLNTLYEWFHSAYSAYRNSCYL